MSDGGAPERLPGFAAGSLIATGFGTGFVAGNCGGLPGPWPQILRIAAALTAAALIAMILRTRSRTAAPAASQPAREFMGTGYWIVVTVEAVALFGGLAVINLVLHRPGLLLPWIALVVGVHFYALAYVWRMPIYHWLATAMTALSIAGFIIYAAGGSKSFIDVVSGVGSGVALYLTVLWALSWARRPAADLADRPAAGHAAEPGTTSRTD